MMESSGNSQNSKPLVEYVQRGYVYAACKPSHILFIGHCPSVCNSLAGKFMGIDKKHLNYQDNEVGLGHEFRFNNGFGVHVISILSSLSLIENIHTLDKKDLLFFLQVTQQINTSKIKIDWFGR
jgi:hypothetical protein